MVSKTGQVRPSTHMDGFALTWTWPTPMNSSVMPGERRFAFSTPFPLGVSFKVV